eukprot:scaffold8374_cov175-Amphora_coffeaeformis.AAC.49
MDANLFLTHASHYFIVPFVSSAMTGGILTRSIKGKVIVGFFLDGLSSETCAACTKQNPLLTPPQSRNYFRHFGYGGFANPCITPSHEGHRQSPISRNST